MQDTSLPHDLMQRFAPAALAVLMLSFAAAAYAQGPVPEREACVVSGIADLGTTNAAAVAGGPQGWLIVWHSDARVFGARVAPDGTLLDSSGFAIATAGGRAWTPSVAWGDGAWLVVWGDGAMRPAAADPRITQTDLYAARVDAAGNVLDATPIVLAANPDFYEHSAQAAWLGDAWLIVWPEIEPDEFGRYDTDRTEGQHLYGVRMSAEGTILDTPPLHMAVRPPSGGVEAGPPFAEGGPYSPVHVRSGDDDTWLVAFTFYTLEELETSSRAVRVRGGTVLDAEPFEISPGYQPLGVTQSASDWLVLNGSYGGSAELVRVGSDGANGERQVLPFEVSRQNAALAAADGAAIATWRVSLSTGGAELRGWSPEPGVEYSDDDAFLIATDPSSSNIECMLAAADNGLVLVLGTTSQGRFALRIDPAEPDSCVGKPIPAPDAGTEPSAPDASTVPDSDTDAAAGGDAAAVDNQWDAATLDPRPARGPDADEGGSDDGCSISRVASDSSGLTHLTPLLFLIVALRFRRRAGSRDPGPGILPGPAS